MFDLRSLSWIGLAVVEVVWVYGCPFEVRPWCDGLLYWILSQLIDDPGWSWLSLFDRDLGVVVVFHWVSEWQVVLLWCFYYLWWTLSTYNFCLFYNYLGYSQMIVMPVFYRDCIVSPYFFDNSFWLPAAMRSSAGGEGFCAAWTKILSLPRMTFCVSSIF